MNANIYYLAISGMQKAIRRSLPKIAVKLAKVAWEEDKDRLYKRLWTVLFEDCSVDKLSLKAFYDVRGNGFTEVALLVGMMATGVKSHDVAMLSWAFNKGLPSEIMSFLLKQGRGNIIEFAEYWKKGEFEVYLYNWIRELCERAKKFDHEKFYAAVPYVMGAINGEYTLEDQAPETYLIDGFFPACAIDCHTRPGKVAYGVYKKHHEDWTYDEKEADNIMFELEGFKHNRCLTFIPGFYEEWQKSRGLDWISAIDFTKIEPDLNRVREWVVHNMFSDDWNELRLRAS